MFVAIMFLVGGLALLVKGADWLVGGASSVARRFGVSELAIGLTVVAFGTSLPELTVNIFSSVNGAADITIGNIVGSNIANILLILGIAGIIAPLAIQTSTVWKEIPFALLAAVLVLIMANDHIVDLYPVAELSRSDGAALIAFFLIYLWYIFGMGGVGGDEIQQPASALKAIGLISIGLVALVSGGKLTVDGAVTIARQIGVSEALIGFSVVAIGTSLPELATSVVAALKRKSDIAVGNIVGSNIFNIFWILGISSIVNPLPFRPAFTLDIAVMIGATVLLFFVVHRGLPHQRLLFWRQRKDHVIEKFDGWAMLGCYAMYMAFLIWRG